MPLEHFSEFEVAVSDRLLDVLQVRECLNVSARDIWLIDCDVGSEMEREHGRGRALQKAVEPREFRLRGSMRIQRGTWPESVRMTGCIIPRGCAASRWAGSQIPTNEERSARVNVARTVAPFSRTAATCLSTSARGRTIPSFGCVVFSVSRCSQMGTDRTSATVRSCLLRDSALMPKR